MKARRRPAQKPAAQELRLSKAAQARSRRELAKFKKFVFTTLRELERHDEMVVTLSVVKNPCGRVSRMRSGMIKGPPWISIGQ
jgi:hypothetical protein